MIKGFVDFVKQGNVVDLAVAVVLGTAFGAVINALVENVLMPLIGQLLAQDPDFDNLLAVTLPGLEGPPMRFGVLLTALVNFLLIAAAIYCVVILPMNKFIAARHALLGQAEETAEEESITLLKEIRDQLKVQTEVVNPAAFATAVESERLLEEQRARAEAASQAQTTSRLGRAKNILWGKD
ncbi:large conductance mechanosensitive channel protein MscL [Nesterenkonia haasae]|uniref:large conductance mechanosensitive channel protein MscL n=1 Tax=Nesterenkonia haasae TaxID=2587813 RepID=UPI0013918529|nr:large conductance mechanosensitive channel protein MscL [Nesterenkonia haasae]NDK32831.1 large conductance mechanosensitive channel protein MscL [Nesterenkonia haasae]